MKILMPSLRISAATTSASPATPYSIRFLCSTGLGKHGRIGRPCPGSVSRAQSTNASTVRRHSVERIGEGAGGQSPVATRAPVRSRCATSTARFQLADWGLGGQAAHCRLVCRPEGSPAQTFRRLVRVPMGFSAVAGRFSLVLPDRNAYKSQVISANI